MFLRPSVFLSQSRSQKAFTFRFMPFTVGPWNPVDLHASLNSGYSLWKVHPDSNSISPGYETQKCPIISLQNRHGLKLPYLRMASWRYGWRCRCVGTRQLHISLDCWSQYLETFLRLSVCALADNLKSAFGVVFDKAKKHLIEENLILAWTINMGWGVISWDARGRYHSEILL